MPRKKIAEAIADAASDQRKRKAAKKAELKHQLGKMFKPLRRTQSDVNEAIPSGIEVLDRVVLGIGGWPVKRVVEVYGDSSAGKTSLMYSALANAQQAGGLAILIETEQSLQVSRAKVFGCDVDEVYLDEPDTFEEVIDGMRQGLAAIPSDTGPNLLAWDSLAMSILKDVKEKGLESKSVGKKAKHMSEQLPAIAQLARRSRTSMMIVNQTRQKIGLAFGNPTTTPGGEAHKFTASIRLQLWAGKRVKVGDRVVGMDTTVVCMKNKVALPHRKAKVRLLFETGWDDHWITMNYAKDMKVIEKKARLTETNYQLAREELGWPGEGTPFKAPPVDAEAEVDLVDEDEEYR